MNYQHQRYLAVAVSVALAGIGVLQVADPADFGLTPVALRWLGVLAAMLGVLAGYLPSVRGRAQDPEFLADRVWELPTDKRERVARDLSDRAVREQGGTTTEARTTLITRPPTWLTDDEIVRRHEGIG